MDVELFDTKIKINVTTIQGLILYNFNKKKEIRVNYLLDYLSIK